MNHIKDYFGKDIIIDTGPLILFLSGVYNYESIGKNSLTKEFSKEDFRLLSEFLRNFKKIIITPHVLTEVSNLVNNKLPKNYFKDFIVKVLKDIKDMKEVTINKEEITSKEILKEIGVADTSILICCEKENKLILTKDFNLSLRGQKKEMPIIHFDTLRAIEWNLK